ncbi:MAG: hypothetical protein ACOY3I_10105 [Verrucomicrobiota bacterium]
MPMNYASADEIDEKDEKSTDGTGEEGGPATQPKDPDEQHKTEEEKRLEELEKQAAAEAEGWREATQASGINPNSEGSGSGSASGNDTGSTGTPSSDASHMSNVNDALGNGGGDLSYGSPKTELLQGTKDDPGYPPMDADNSAHSNHDYKWGRDDSAQVNDGSIPAHGQSSAKPPVDDGSIPAHFPPSENLQSDGTFPQPPPAESTITGANDPIGEKGAWGNATEKLQSAGETAQGAVDAIKSEAELVGGQFLKDLQDPKSLENYARAQDLTHGGGDLVDQSQSDPMKNPVTWDRVVDNWNKTADYLKENASNVSLEKFADNVSGQFDGGETLTEQQQLTPSPSEIAGKIWNAFEDQAGKIDQRVAAQNAADVAYRQYESNPTSENLAKYNQAQDNLTTAAQAEEKYNSELIRAGLMLNPATATPLFAAEAVTGVNAVNPNENLSPMEHALSGAFAAGEGAGLASRAFSETGALGREVASGAEGASREVGSAVENGRLAENASSIDSTARSWGEQLEARSTPRTGEVGETGRVAEVGEAGRATASGETSSARATETVGESSRASSGETATVKEVDPLSGARQDLQTRRADLERAMNGPESATTETRASAAERSTLSESSSVERASIESSRAGEKGSTGLAEEATPLEKVAAQQKAWQENFEKMMKGAEPPADTANQIAAKSAERSLRQLQEEGHKLGTGQKYQDNINKSISDANKLPSWEQRAQALENAKSQAFKEIDNRFRSDPEFKKSYLEQNTAKENSSVAKNSNPIQESRSYDRSASSSSKNGASERVGKSVQESTSGNRALTQEKTDLRGSGYEQSPTSSSKKTGASPERAPQRLAEASRESAQRPTLVKEKTANSQLQRMLDDSSSKPSRTATEIQREIAKLGNDVRNPTSRSTAAAEKTSLQKASGSGLVQSATTPHDYTRATTDSFKQSHQQALPNEFSKEKSASSGARDFLEKQLEKVDNALNKVSQPVFDTAHSIGQYFKKSDWPENFSKNPAERARWALKRGNDNLIKKSIREMQDAFKSKYDGGVTVVTDTLPSPCFNITARLASPKNALKALEAIYSAAEEHPPALVKKETPVIYIVSDLKDQRGSFGGMNVQEGKRIYINTEWETSRDQIKDAYHHEKAHSRPWIDLWVNSQDNPVLQKALRYKFNEWNEIRFLFQKKPLHQAGLYRPYATVNPLEAYATHAEFQHSPNNLKIANQYPEFKKVGKVYADQYEFESVRATYIDAQVHLRDWVDGRLDIPNERLETYLQDWKRSLDWLDKNYRPYDEVRASQWDDTQTLWKKIQNKLSPELRNKYSDLIKKSPPILETLEDTASQKIAASKNSISPSSMLPPKPVGVEDFVKGFENTSPQTSFSRTSSTRASKKATEPQITETKLFSDEDPVTTVPYSKVRDQLGPVGGTRQDQWPQLQQQPKLSRLTTPKNEILNKFKGAGPAGETAAEIYARGPQSNAEKFFLQAAINNPSLLAASKDWNEFMRNIYNSGQLNSLFSGNPATTVPASSVKQQLGPVGGTTHEHWQGQIQNTGKTAESTSQRQARDLAKEKRLGKHSEPIDVEQFVDEAFKAGAYIKDINTILKDRSVKDRKINLAIQRWYEKNKGDTAVQKALGLDNTGQIPRNPITYQMGKDGVPQPVSAEVFASGEYETCYRVMTSAEYDKLRETGKLPQNQNGQTPLSPTMDYVEKYRGQLIEFHLDPGTIDELFKVAVSDGSRNVRRDYPALPLQNGDWRKRNVLFKSEESIISIGLGQEGGEGLKIFNSGLQGFTFYGPSRTSFLLNK